MDDKQRVTGIASSVRKRRLIGAWIGFAPSIVPGFEALLLIVQHEWYMRYPADHGIGVKLLNYTVRVLGTPSGFIVVVGPILHLIGLVSWYGLLGDKSVTIRTKTAIGVCLMLAIWLTFSCWWRFLHLGD